MHSDTKTKWRAVLIAIAAGMIAAAHYGKAPPALPNIRAEIPVSLIVGGWIMSIFSGTGSVLSVITGSLADRIGARRFCVFGLLSLSAGATFGGIANSGNLLLVSRFIEGLGFISIAVSAPILIMRSTQQKDIQLALGMWTTYMPSGMALAIVASPFLLSMFSWRSVWFSAALISLAWAGVIYFAFEKDNLHHHDDTSPPISFWGNLRLTLSRQGPWLLSLSFLCYTVQWISLMAWLPSFLVQERDMDLKAIGFVVAAVVAANIPGNLSSSYLIKRGMARSVTLLISAVGMGVSVYLVFEPSLADEFRLLACVAFSFFGGMLPGTVLSSAPVVAPTRSQIGTVNGMMVQGSHLGQMAGPPILAVIVTMTGDWGDVRWLMIAASGGVALLALLFRRIETA